MKMTLQATNKGNCTQDGQDMAEKKMKPPSFLIAEQNSTQGVNYIETKILNKQQNREKEIKQIIT